MALARLFGALLYRLYGGGRVRRPRSVALRAGRLRHHAADVRRALPAGDRGGAHPAAGDQGAGGADELIAAGFFDRQLASVPAMISELFSATMIVAGWMFGEGIAGITDASTTRRPSMPRTRSWLSTT